MKKLLGTQLRIYDLLCLCSDQPSSPVIGGVLKPGLKGYCWRCCRGVLTCQVKITGCSLRGADAGQVSWGHVLP